ncbi:right-handed parallel beta-helix repeat-containing protein [Methylobacterium sp. W2]|nr:right-handed parallel beta-helix repeat-containing protein [Methylobacterium sp. W2]
MTRHDGPIQSEYAGQVIENLDIYAEGTAAVSIQHDGVVLRNVRIHHSDGVGVSVIGADGVRIENSEIINAGAPASGPETDTGQNNIDVDRGTNLTVTGTTLREGSSGIYLLNSPGAALSGIEGYDFHGPFPRGQLVQFDKSPDSTLDTFYVKNNPDVAWTEDNISVYQSANVTISNGVIDGNNSPSGVGVMFEEGSTGGRVSHVDAIHMGNGAFSTYTDDVSFDHTRSIDNIATDQGRGAPLSNALIWNTSGEGVSVTNSSYENAGNPTNILWGEVAATVADVTEADIAPQAHWTNGFAWNGDTPIVTIPEPVDPAPVLPVPDPVEVPPVVTVPDPIETPPTVPVDSIALTRHDGPIQSEYAGQVIENLDIYAEGTAAVSIQHDGVVLRNVRIHHSDGVGVSVIGADGVRIENSEIINAGAPASGPETDTGQNNIDVDRGTNLTVIDTTLREGSSGIYLLNSPGAALSGIEGYDFHGPFPRGQLVQFDKSPDSTLDTFYVKNDAATSWTEDNISVYQSANVTISNGVIDGNNSPSGVGVMFEEGSTGGRVSHVDAIHMGNGAFSTYTDDVSFDFTRSFDNIATDQGRGAPLSNALIWNTSGEGVSVTNSSYENAGNPTNILWGEVAATVADATEADITPQAHLINEFAWS